MPSRRARALSSIRAAMTNPPSTSRGLCGGVFLRSRANCLSLSVFIGFLFDSFLSLCGLLRRRAFEPVLIMRRTEAGFNSRSRDETLIVQLCAKVAGVNISAHFSGVSGCAQELTDELIHSDRFGTGDLERTV